MIEIIRTLNGSEIRMTAIRMGADIQTAVYGGDKPHIGAISIAAPFERDGAVKATVSTLTILTHREDILSRRLAELLCKKLKTVVTVSCGIHFDRISGELIAETENIVLDMGGELALRLGNGEDLE